MAQQVQKGEAWGTQNVVVEGGLYLDKDVLYQAMQMPGSARSLVNYEPSLDGGYHRINGYGLYDTNQLPNGASQVYGAIVNTVDGSVIAMQSGNTYRSVGSGWTKINGADTHTSMGKVQWTFYAWATNRFAFVDGDPNAYPVRIEASGAYTVLSSAPKGQKFICEFSKYLWMSSGDGNVTFSAPGDDTNYSAINGAGQINVGFPIVGLGVWRGALYVFGTSRISQITGTSSADWQLTTLTTNIGMIGPYTLQEVNGDLVFLSSDGLRTISGTARVFDRELGVITRPINTLVIPMGANNWCSVAIRTKSQYRMFQAVSTTDAGTAPGIIGALKLQSNGSVAWEWSTTSGIKASCASSGLVNGNELIIHAAWDGYVYKHDYGTDFNGTAIQSVYKTPHLVYNDPGIRKILYKLCLNTRASGPTSINLGVSYDYLVSGVAQPVDQTLVVSGGGGAYDSGITYDQTPIIYYDVYPDDRVCTNLIGSGFTSSFTFTSNGGNDFSIQAFSIQYGEGTRR